MHDSSRHAGFLAHADIGFQPIPYHYTALRRKAMPRQGGLQDQGRRFSSQQLSDRDAQTGQLAGISKAWLEWLVTHEQHPVSAVTQFCNGIHCAWQGLVALEPCHPFSG